MFKKMQFFVFLSELPFMSLVYSRNAMVLVGVIVSLWIVTVLIIKLLKVQGRDCKLDIVRRKV